MKVLFFLKTTPVHKQKEILKKFCGSLKAIKTLLYSKDVDVSTRGEYEECDVAVIFGSWKIKPKKEMEHHVLKNDIVDKHKGTLIVIESPLLGNKNTDTHEYYRVGLGHYMYGLGDFKNEISNSDRFKQLQLQLPVHINKWRPFIVENEGHILILGQDFNDDSLFGIDFTWWIYNTIKYLMKYTTRRIVIRDHPGNGNQLKDFIKEKFGYNEQVRYSDKDSISDDLRGCHCSVSYTSVESIDSILAGVPVIPCSEYNFVYPISSRSLQEIENPRIAGADTGSYETDWKGNPKEQLLYDLANAQWSVKEIEEAKPWIHLMHNDKFY